MTVCLCSCVSVNSFNGIYCSFMPDSLCIEPQYCDVVTNKHKKKFCCNMIIKIDSSSIEIERFCRDLSTSQCYGQGTLIKVANRKKLFKYMQNPHMKIYYQIGILPTNDTYILKRNNNRIIYIEQIDGKKYKTILQKNWCNCVPDYTKSIIYYGIYHK